MSYKTKKSLFAKMDENSESNENKTNSNIKTKTTKNKSMKVHMN